VLKSIFRALRVDHVVAITVNTLDIVPPLVSLIFLFELHPQAFLTEIFTDNLLPIDFAVRGLYSTVLATSVTVLGGVARIAMDALPEDKVRSEVHVFLG